MTDAPSMTDPLWPDFSAEGYQVLKELGHNRMGGRVTYLAQEFNTERRVVIKQFQFATGQNRWEDYEACQQEIHILKTLDHPQIPSYIDSFQTATGFCMVQDYKPAPSLAEIRPWTAKQIRHIAIAVLTLLKYLQQRIPPIIHRDLKPENILVDDQMNVYLVDFGFARLGGGQVAVSSVVKGTLGFMPPEQLFNRELTPASDLYSLGMTLLCLLTHVPSTDVGLLMDDAGRVQIKPRLPHLSPPFYTWLATMTQSQVQQRYANADEALRHLVPIQRLTQSPWARLRPLRSLAWGTAALTSAALMAIVLYPPLRQATLPPLAARFSALLSPRAQDSNALLPPPSFEVTFTNDLSETQTPVAPLTAVPAEAPWVAYVAAHGVTNGQHRVTCELLTESGQIIDAFSRTSTLLAEQGQLTFWCRYRLGQEAGAEERPHWFQLRWAGQPVVKQVLPIQPD
jgi:serine/threonine protein kinase